MNNSIELPNNIVNSKDIYFFEEKKKEPSLSPNYYFAQNHLTQGGHGDYPPIHNFIQSKLNNNDLIPLRGPINKPSLTCAEDLTYKVSSNDRLGFKNSDETYNKKVDLIIPINCLPRKLFLPHTPYFLITVLKMGF